MNLVRHYRFSKHLVNAYALDIDMSSWNSVCLTFFVCIKALLLLNNFQNKKRREVLAMLRKRTRLSPMISFQKVK